MAPQLYHVTVPDDSVIVGNDVVIKCNIPSFVTDFLSVVAWVNSEGSEFQPGPESGKDTRLSHVLSNYKGQTSQLGGLKQF